MTWFGFCIFGFSAFVVVVVVFWLLKIKGDDYHEKVSGIYNLANGCGCTCDTESKPHEVLQREKWERFKQGFPNCAISTYCTVSKGACCMKRCLPWHTRTWEDK